MFENFNREEIIALVALVILIYILFKLTKKFFKALAISILIVAIFYILLQYLI